MSKDSIKSQVDVRRAGLLLFIGATQFMIGMMVAEAFYPNYSISANFISDLGATCRENCIIYQPTSSIFNGSVLLFGLFTLIAAYLIHRGAEQKLVAIIFALASIGIMGVGIFPETARSLHGLFSLIAFLFGGISAIIAYRLERRPLNYISILLGLVTLVALLLFSLDANFGLGPGGMERMIAYPVILWAIGFGAYLMNT
jgi:hypothetical membrane protein